jgi:hypothetical protein
LQIPLQIPLGDEEAQMAQEERPVVRTPDDVKQGRNVGLIYVLGASLALAVVALAVVYLAS